MWLYPKMAFSKVDTVQYFLLVGLYQDEVAEILLSGKTDYPHCDVDHTPIPLTSDWVTEEIGK